MNPLASSLLAWLLTYLIHSTVLLGLAWVVTRRWRLEPAASDLLWKVALLAGLVTGTIQSRLELATPAAVTLSVAARPQAPTLVGSSASTHEVLEVQAYASAGSTSSYTRTAASSPLSPRSNTAIPACGGSWELPHRSKLYSTAHRTVSSVTKIPSTARGAK